MNFVGDGDFEAIGSEFANYFKEIGHLKPRESILEVGCGIGRMAVPLMDYLDKDGSYEGFDIIAEGIRWCQKNITTKAPHFRFQWADVYNYSYNPTGKVKAAEYTFPCESGCFDFVILTSVFTHMLSGDLEHYMSEISRVLKPGGRSFVTYFILNDKSRALIAEGVSRLLFKYRQPDGSWVADPQNPEISVAYPESYLQELYTRHRMEISRPVYYGNWCGREEFLSYQDIILGYKK